MADIPEHRNHGKCIWCRRGRQHKKVVENERMKDKEQDFYYGKFGGEKTLRGDVWQLKRQKNTVHPTMKPIELIGMAIEDNPSAKIIYDGFGGSGSTLIACEQLGRKCYMMELDPKYCDVIRKRYWKFVTGSEEGWEDGTRAN